MATTAGNSPEIHQRGQLVRPLPFQCGNKSSAQKSRIFRKINDSVTTFCRFCHTKICHLYLIPSDPIHPSTHPPSPSTCVLQIRSPGVSTRKGRISQQLRPQRLGPWWGGSVSWIPSRWSMGVAQKMDGSSQREKS